jgi:hypothetical protein
MKHEDIIRMAREAGISKPWDQEPVQWETLERFANLVAAAEREACAKICDKVFDDSEIDKPEPAPFLWFLKRKEECAFSIREGGGK